MGRYGKVCSTASARRKSTEQLESGIVRCGNSWQWRQPCARIVHHGASGCHMMGNIHPNPAVLLHACPLPHASPCMPSVDISRYQSHGSNIHSSLFALLTVKDAAAFFAGPARCSIGNCVQTHKTLVICVRILRMVSSEGLKVLSLDKMSCAMSCSGPVIFLANHTVRSPPSTILRKCRAETQWRKDK